MMTKEKFAADEMKASDISARLEKNRFTHADFSTPILAAAVKEKQVSITGLTPGKEVARTIGGVIKKTIPPLIEALIMTKVFVIDAASEDRTAKVAQEAGAQVLQGTEIASEVGESRGKGDALWRGLQYTGGDIVAFLDGDTKDPVPEHLIGILGPPIMFDHIKMVRACFDRPFKTHAEEVRPHEGGRVTELLARPIINMHWPELAGSRQPLAGEFAARRSLLERLPFPVGCGVEIGTLVDAYSLVGLNALAEVDVGQRQNAHKPLRDLTTMAGSIPATTEQRLAGREKTSQQRMYIPWLNEYREIDTTERLPIHKYRLEQLVYPCPPFVMVERVRMFRDVGGSCSSLLRPGLVFRGGNPSTMTSSSLKKLLELGIKKVFDLRSAIEMDNHGRVHGDVNPSSTDDIYPGGISEFGIERVVAPVFPHEEWHQDRRAARLQNYANAFEGYAEAYHHTLRSGAKAFIPILHHLAQPNPSPILVHYTAGKDRTGVTAMLILLLAGCEDDTIAEEYALNDIDSRRAWGISAINRLLSQPGLSGNVGVVENVIRAQKEYMLATLDRFRAEYGCVEVYLERVPKMDEDAIRAIKNNLVCVKN